MTTMWGMLGKSRDLALVLLLLFVSSIYTAPAADSAITSTTSSSSSSSSSEESAEVVSVDQDEGVNTPLETSLESFLSLVASEKIQNMTAEAYLESRAVRDASNFLRSREFIDAKDKLLEAPEVQEFVKFLNQSGLNVVRFVRKVGNRTGIPVTINSDGEEMNFSESSDEDEEVVASTEATTTLTQLVDKLLAELPQEQFFAVFFEKMESDNEFSDFVERLNGDEFEAILLKVQVC